MANYYIREGFTVEQLHEKMKEVNGQLRETGQLYDNEVKEENWTDFQKTCMNSHMDGYELGEQIHDSYAEIGAIMEALKHHGVEV